MSFSSAHYRSVLLSGTALALITLSLCPGYAPQARAGDFVISTDMTEEIYGNSTDAADPTANYLGNPSGNSVTVIGGTIVSDIYGAATVTIPANGNSVTITGGLWEGEYIIGAFGTSASGNSVTITGGTFDALTNGRINGAHTSTGNVSGNSVDISNATVTDLSRIAGGYTSDGDAINNSVTVSNVIGTIPNVSGGSSENGNATDNSVTLNAEVTFTRARGGDSDAASTDVFTGNTLTINDQTAIVTDLISNFQTINFGYAGSLDTTSIDITPTGSSEAGTTFNTNANAVEIAGVISGTGDLIKAGSGTLTLSGANSYTGATQIDEGTLASTITSLSTTSDISVASGAALELNGEGTVATAISGDGELVINSSNYILLNNGGTTIGSVSAKNGELSLQSTLATSLLELYGNATFTSNGYFSLGSESTLTIQATGASANWDGDLVTNGATLNFVGAAQNLLASVSEGPLLYVDGAAVISDSAVNVGTTGSASLAVGDEILLLASGDTLTADNISQGTGIVTAGVTKEYGIDLITEDNSLTATVTSAGATEQSKALSEGVASSAVLVNQGSDTVAGQGMTQAMAAAGAADGNGAGAGANGAAGFAAVSGGSTRTNTGSHVDVTGVSLMGGLASDIDLTSGQLMLGVFGEYGHGNYNTYNSFSGSVVLGEGNSSYVGGGLLGRFDLFGGDEGHAYLEGSLRAGQVSNSYTATSGLSASYDTSALYYGGHIGAGYVWSVAPATTLDLFGQYFVTRQDGDTVQLTTGDTVSFDAVTSSRVRAGARLDYSWTDNISTYVGASVEHEFDGEAKASTSGLAIDAPSLAGTTGIGEVGMTFTPSHDLPLSLALGVQGYVGKRQGVTGSLQAHFSF